MPNKIDVKKFEILKNELENVLKEEMSIEYKTETSNLCIYYRINNIMNDCFKLDTNQVPHKYQILPISQIIKEFNSFY